MSAWALGAGQPMLHGPCMCTTTYCAGKVASSPHVPVMPYTRGEAMVPCGVHAEVLSTGETVCMQVVWRACATHTCVRALVLTMVRGTTSPVPGSMREGRTANHHPWAMAYPTCMRVSPTTEGSKATTPQQQGRMGGRGICGGHANPSTPLAPLAT